MNYTHINEFHDGKSPRPRPGRRSALLTFPAELEMSIASLVLLPFRIFVPIVVPIVVS
jgi:hypothetical protein